MAHKITDDKQEYQYSSGFTTPSGHEFHYYDTPENQRLVLKHASGSHIEFKADGSVMIVSLKDLHMHSSIVSDATDQESGSADTTTQHIETNYTLDVSGTLNIKCARLNIEAGETAHLYAGTDFRVSSNNYVNKATESISLEGRKSIYMDADEMKQRMVTSRTEVGDKEGATGTNKSGGQNIINVTGNAVIRNNDPTGGITLSAAGYLNLVCGQERIDVVGKDFKTTDNGKPGVPISPLGMGTFSQYVFTPVPAGPQNKSKMPGDYAFFSEGGAAYTYALKSGGSTVSPINGLQQTVMMGDMNQVVAAGNRTRKVGQNEDVVIAGVQTVVATKIFLN